FFLREDLDSSFNYKILNEFLAEKFSINLLADNFLEYDLHYVLFTKTTNLYFLTLIYLMVAEKLNLPIYGLPLKEKIVLLYCHTHCGHAEMVYEDCIDFYFTPGIYGSVYTLDDLKMFALANNKEITLEETLPKDNSAIINHWLRMMSKSLSLLSSDSKLYISYQQNINSLINR
nr:hypothetical protein [Chitinophagales bacterium]